MTKRVNVTAAIVLILFGLAAAGCDLTGGGDPTGTGDPTDTEAPTPPGTIELAGDALLTASPTASWTASTDNVAVTGYEVGVGTDETTADVVDFVDIGTSTQRQFSSIDPLLSSSTDYYILVRARDAEGNVSEVTASAVWSPGLVMVSGGLALPESPTELSDCRSYLESAYYNDDGDGRYWIDPDGAGGVAAQLCDCDMTEDGGGWTLVLNYVHQGGTNPALDIRTSTLPLIGSSTLGDDEAGSAAYWGHAAPALLGLFTVTEMRWYSVSSSHSRIMSFKTSHAGTISYMTTGSGSALGINSSYTALSGHTANLPASAVSAFANQGDLALTEFPFYEAAVSHWGIRGQGTRWEADDYNGDFSQDTIHRVWIR